LLDLLGILDNYSGFTNTIKAEFDSKLEEGLTINKKKENENTRDNQSFTCPNPSCGRVFTNPIKAENLTLKSGVYNACPYCLTEINIEKSTIAAEEKETMRLEPHAGKEIKQKERVMLEKASVDLPNKSGCTHHFGYLSQRSTKEKIPEECVMCEKIVQCMLQGVRG
jgi:hypothetical protein